MEKLTDNKIIKALKKMIDLMCCEDDWQRASTIEDALDLINRQKAEIERLKKVIETMTNEQLQFGFEAKSKIEQAKAEAIKEFAERLCDGRVSNDPVVIAVKVELKETVGDVE